MAPTEFAMNGKRKAEDDSPTAISRNVRSKPATVDLPAEIDEYKFKVLVNIPVELPFFAETAQSILDLWPSVDIEAAVPRLVEGLQEHGASDKTIQAAVAIWRKSTDRNTLRDIGARCITQESLRQALVTLILSSTDAPACQVPQQTQAKLKAAIRACFSSKPAGQDANDATGAQSKVLAQQATARLNEGLQAPTGPKAHLPMASRSEQAIGGSVAPTTGRQANGEQHMPTTVDQDSLDALIAEGSGANAQQATKENKDVLSLLEDTLNSGPDKKQSSTWPTTSKAVLGAPTQPAAARESTAASSTASIGLKIKDMAIVRQADGSIPPTPDSTMMPKGPHRTLSESDSREHRRDSSPTRRTSDVRPILRADTYRPFEGDRPKLSSLDAPLADRISARQALEERPDLPPHKMTCYFWFIQDFCSRGERCHYQHELLDYVAEYIPGKHRNVALRIVPRDTMQETRRATLANSTYKKGHPLPDDDGAASTALTRFGRNRSSSDAGRPPYVNRAQSAMSDTPIVDMLWGTDNITLGLRNTVIQTIIKNIRERGSRSRREFVIELFDHSGRMSNFDLAEHSGLPSRLVGIFNGAPEAFSAHGVRRRMEDMLRPFIVANKSKFLDFPEEAFSTRQYAPSAAHSSSSPGSNNVNSNAVNSNNGGGVSLLKRDSSEYADPPHRNWSKRFNGGSPARKA